MNYDAWKTTDPADRALGRTNGHPVTYRCLRCGWRGQGSIARAEHHRRTNGHGIIVPKDDPRFNQPATESEVA